MLVSAGVAFNVTEVLEEVNGISEIPRLFFTAGNQVDYVGEGVFSFTAPDTNLTVSIVAYTFVSSYSAHVHYSYT